MNWLKNNPDHMVLEACFPIDKQWQRLDFLCFHYLFHVDNAGNSHTETTTPGIACVSVDGTHMNMVSNSLDYHVYIASRPEHNQLNFSGLYHYAINDPRYTLQKQAQTILAAEKSSTKGLLVSRPGQIKLMNPNPISKEALANILSTGTTKDISAVVLGKLQSDNGSGQMWLGRTSSMTAAILNALVFLRDHDRLKLDWHSLKDQFSLERIEALAANKELPQPLTDPLKIYLRSIPGYVEDQQKQSEEVYNQHGYLQMQTNIWLSAFFYAQPRRFFNRAKRQTTMAASSNAVD